MTEPVQPSPPAEESAHDHARDLELMVLVARGDEGAFQELIEIHQGRVIGTAAKMLGSVTEAEDLAQEVFLRVWKSAARFQAEARFTTWLFTIMKNLVFNELRRRGRRPTESLDAPRFSDGQETRMDEHADVSVKTADRALLDEEMQAAIQTAIDALPEVQRMAMVLRRYDDVSYEEIGEILNLTVPAVKSVIFRARETLKEKLKRYLG